jgi:hypothetical protein
VTSSTNAPSARPRRLGLYGPFAALAILLAAWAGAWLWIKASLEKGLDESAASLSAAGGRFAWSQRRISGYPFRFDVDFSDLTWQGSDGWGVAVPDLKAETSIFAFGHWVAYAPAGASLLRPNGEVRIAARALRASLSSMEAHPPTVSVEGMGLTFTPAPGTDPFALASADELHVHTRAGPSDRGAFLVELDGARLPDRGFFGHLASGSPASLVIDARFDHASALAGRDWSERWRTWSQAGGRLSLKQARFSLAGVSLVGQGEGLAIGSDGRPAGPLQVDLSGDVRGHALPSGRVTLHLENGRAHLGPFEIGPSPKLY